MKWLFYFVIAFIVLLAFDCVVFYLIYLFKRNRDQMPGVNGLNEIIFKEEADP